MPNKQGKGKIDYLNYTVSPFKGKCPNITNHAPCERYCYMAQFFHRFKHGKKPMNPEIRIDEKEMFWSPKEPSKIGVCFNLDMFHPEIMRDAAIRTQIAHAKRNPQHTWIYLTKFPERYAEFNFPTNAWLGTTVDGLPHTADNVYKLLKATEPTHIRFGSFEPLLSRPQASWIAPTPQDMYDKPQYYPDWIIVGADTTPGAMQPPKLWIDNLVIPAKKMGIKVWMKDSLSFMDYMIKELPSQVEINVIQEPKEPILFQDEFPSGPCGRKVSLPDSENRYIT